jgi:hypothetical protein
MVKLKPFQRTVMFQGLSDQRCGETATARPPQAGRARFVENVVERVIAGGKGGAR